MIRLARKFWSWRLTRRGDIAFTATIVIGFTLSTVSFGVLCGLYWAQGGSIPGWMESRRASPIITPVDSEVQTYGEVIEFLERDKTDEVPYDRGFNCVEFALLVARNAKWEGISCGVFGLSYSGTGIGHAIVGFPTRDEGWVFIEPQDDGVIFPIPGSYYNGRKVVSVEQLVMGWEEIEWIDYSG